MYTILSGAIVQQIASDGGLLEKESEKIDRDIWIHKQALLCTPEVNNGKWLFSISTELILEVEAKYVKTGRTEITQ